MASQPYIHLKMDLDDILLLTVMDNHILVTTKALPTLEHLEDFEGNLVNLESFKKGRRCKNDVNDFPLSSYERDDDGDDIPF